MQHRHHLQVGSRFNRHHFIDKAFVVVEATLDCVLSVLAVFFFELCAALVGREAELQLLLLPASQSPEPLALCLELRLHAGAPSIGAAHQVVIRLANRIRQLLAQMLGDGVIGVGIGLAAQLQPLGHRLERLDVHHVQARSGEAHRHPLLHHRHPLLVGDRALHHHHHLTGLQAITQLQHRCAVSREADLAAVGEPIHQGVQIPAGGVLLP